jgi:hypothetical protein
VRPPIVKRRITVCAPQECIACALIVAASETYVINLPEAIEQRRFMEAQLSIDAGRDWLRIIPC